MNENSEEYSLKLENEKYYYRRIDHDSFFLRKVFFGKAWMESVDLTASRTIFGTGCLKGGSLLFITDEGEVEIAEGDFGMFIPPFSIYRCRGAFESIELSLLVSAKDLYNKCPSAAAIFPTDGDVFFGEESQVDKLLTLFDNRIPFRQGMSPDIKAAEARKMIEAEYEELTEVSEIAGRLGLENWELSRIFKKSFGIGPLRYLNNLRTNEAVYRILDSGKNSKIIDIAFNVGFRDLSRFNKQFRKFTRFIPRNLYPKK